MSFKSMFTLEVYRQISTQHIYSVFTFLCYPSPMRVPLASLGLRQKDIDAAIKVLTSNKLTMGSNVKEFESMMASYLGVKFFIMVNSGSSANLAIIEALLRPSSGVAALQPGDGVILPSVAWPTTVWPVIQLGLKPVFVDVEQDSIAIDLDLAEQELSTNNSIKAMFPIHPLGYGISNTKLEDFCLKNDLLLINDVCESLGSWRNGSHAGVCGIASSFSFYFSHHITTMEGGGVATNHPEFADDIRSIRSHGWSRDRSDIDVWHKTSKSKLATQSISENHLKFQFITTGFNIRPMEIQAAIGIEQLKDLNKFIDRRRSIARQVKKCLEGTVFQVIDAGTLDNEATEEQHSWMLIPIRINYDLSENQKKFLDLMLEKYEIEARPALTGNFLRQPVMLTLKDMPSPSKFKVAELISSNYFLVGCHQDLTNEQVEFLSESLKKLALNLVTI